MKHRRKTIVARLIKQSTEFFAGLAEGCKVDEAKAKEVWSEFASGMQPLERTDFLLNGREAGLAISKYVRVDSTGQISIKYATA